MLHRLAICTALVSALSGCLDLDRGGPENETPENETPENETPENETPENETPENEGPQPTATAALAGAYSITSHWDLSSLVAPENLGAAATDFAVDFAVSALGVPSFLEDEAADAVRGLIGDRVRDPVIAAAADSAVLSALAANLITVNVESTWDLPAENIGTETVQSLSFEHAGADYTLDTTSADPLAELGGPIEIDGDVDSLEITRYPLAIRLVPLIRPAAESVIDSALAAVDCDALALAITGDDGEISIDLRLTSYTVTADDLASLCADQLDSLAGEILAVLDVEVPLDLGGGIEATDLDADGIADELRSSASYHGVLDLLPVPLPFDAGLSGVRQ